MNHDRTLYRRTDDGGLLVAPNPDWYIAKRKGGRVRWRNRVTGAWERYWEKTPWSPFNADGTVRDLAVEGFHVIGSMNEDGIDVSLGPFSVDGIVTAPAGMYGPGQFRFACTCSASRYAGDDGWDRNCPTHGADADPEGKNA